MNNDILASEKCGDTLYVSDLDGTLLDASSHISHRTAQIINHLVDYHGLKFTVATARTIATVIPLMRDLHTTLPYITMSGAAMWNTAERRFEDTQTICPDVVRRVCGICERHGVRPFVYRRHGNAIHAHHYGALSESEHAFVEARDHTAYKRFLLDDPDYHTHSDETLLIFAMQRGHALERAHAEIIRQTRCSAVCYHDNADPGLSLLEVFAEGCTKAAAIRRLAEQVRVQRVVVFGDNLNDLPMMQAADHSVAVGNAVPQVRARANEVIGPNTDDSVALWLQTHVRH